MIPSENVQQYIIHDLNLNELSQCLVCQPKLIHINPFNLYELGEMVH